MLFRSQAAAGAGVELRTGENVSRVIVEGGRARAVVTEGERVEGDAVLLAAGAWTSELVASFGMRLRVEPRRGQMIALAHVPHAACLVPERREERTTEGGLDVAGGHNSIAPVVRRLVGAGIRVSCFIDADPVQARASKDMGAQVIELHTGAYCDAVRERTGEADRLLANLRDTAAEAARLGLEVHAGHGIDYETVKPIAAIPELAELNIGHFLIGEAIFVGLAPAIQRMRALMDQARANSKVELAQGLSR